MIERWVAQELRQIERTISSDDPSFAYGLRSGRPCPPREYRRRRARLVATVLAVVLSGGVAVGLTTAALFGALAAVLLGALAAAAVGAASMLTVVVAGRVRARRRPASRRSHGR